jgi:C4-dicarboxylate transporter DctQ subunit
MKFLDRLEEWLVTFLMGGATLIIFVAVVHRYLTGIDIPGLQDWLLKFSFAWAQELTIIMFVWMAKFGAAYGVRTGIHVGVDVMINRLSDGKRKWFISFWFAGGCRFTGIIATLGYHFVMENGLHYAWLTGAKKRVTLRRSHNTGSGMADLDCLLRDSAGLQV